MKKDQLVARLLQQYARIKAEMGPKMGQLTQLGQDLSEFNDREKHFLTTIRSLRSSKEELSTTLQKNAQNAIADLESKWHNINNKIGVGT